MDSNSPSIYYESQSFHGSGFGSASKDYLTHQLPDAFERQLPPCCRDLCRFLVLKCLKAIYLAGKWLVAVLFSHVGLCALVSAYALLGAFMFRAIELPTETERQRLIRNDTRMIMVELRKYTEEEKFLTEELWKKKAEEILKAYEKKFVRAVNLDGFDGNDDKLKTQWSLSGALLYSFTVITTIGYGHIAPRTTLGRMVTMVYATIGIPLMLMCLANIAESLARLFTFIYFRICCLYCYWKEKRKAKVRKTMIALQKYHGGIMRKGGYPSGFQRTGSYRSNNTMKHQQHQFNTKLQHHGMTSSKSGTGSGSTSQAGTSRTEKIKKQSSANTETEMRTGPNPSRSPHQHSPLRRGLTIHGDPRSIRRGARSGPSSLDFHRKFTTPAGGSPKLYSLGSGFDNATSFATAMTSTVASNVASVYSETSATVKQIPTFMKRQMSRAQTGIHSTLQMRDGNNNGGNPINIASQIIRKGTSSFGHRHRTLSRSQTDLSDKNRHFQIDGRTKQLAWNDCSGCKINVHSSRCVVCYSLLGNTEVSEAAVLPSEINNTNPVLSLLHSVNLAKSVLLQASHERPASPSTISEQSEMLYDELINQETHADYAAKANCSADNTLTRNASRTRFADNLHGYESENEPAAAQGQHRATPLNRELTPEFRSILAKRSMHHDVRTPPRICIKSPGSSEGGARISPRNKDSTCGQSSNLATDSTNLISHSTSRSLQGTPHLKRPAPAPPVSQMTPNVISKSLVAGSDDSCQPFGESTKCACVPDMYRSTVAPQQFLGDNLHSNLSYETIFAPDSSRNITRSLTTKRHGDIGHSRKGLTVGSSGLSEEGSVRSARKTAAKEPEQMPVSVGIILLISFIFGGAVLFAFWEDWNIFDAAYFCFITLTTIGFGDLVPGESMDKDQQEALIVCSMYLLIGMALIAMCFKLMQDDVVQKTRWLGQKIGLLSKDEEQVEDEDDDFDDDEEYDYEEYDEQLENPEDDVIVVYERPDLDHTTLSSYTSNRKEEMVGGGDYVIKFTRH